jgi:hypothetical protein
MKRFLDLGDFTREEVLALIELARRLERQPEPRALAGKVLGLLFFNPSLRTLASFQVAMARMGGSSFVINPGQGTWQLETRSGVVMDGAAAEHVREGIPVLASYCDALGIRAFAEGKDLARDLAEENFNAMAALTDKPLINLESALNHPCQALADWKTLDDLEVPRHARFVLSWAYHPRALPLAVPAAALHMAALRGMDVTVLRHGARAARRDALGGRGARDRRARRRTARRPGAVREGMGRHGRLRRCRRGCAPARRPQGLVRARGLVRGRARVSPHALPAGAPQYRHRRCGARWRAQRRAARGLQPPAGADGGAAPHAYLLKTHC